MAPRGRQRSATIRRIGGGGPHPPSRTGGRAAAVSPDGAASAAGKVAVITGASRGLGAGMAVHFAAAGLHLGLCARHRPSLVVNTRPTAHEGHFDQAEAPWRAAVDVFDHDAVAAFRDQVVDRFGRIDLWINNAGVLDPIGPLADADGAALARNIDVNVTGVL